MRDIFQPMSVYLFPGFIFCATIQIRILVVLDLCLLTVRNCRLVSLDRLQYAADIDIVAAVVCGHRNRGALDAVYLPFPLFASLYLASRQDVAVLCFQVVRHNLHPEKDMELDWLQLKTVIFFKKSTIGIVGFRMTHVSYIFETSVDYRDEISELLF